MSVADSHGQVLHITDINMPGVIKSFDILSGAATIDRLSVETGGVYNLSICAQDGYGNVFSPSDAVWRAEKNGTEISSVYVNASNKLFISDNDSSLSGSEIKLICTCGGMEKSITLYVDKDESPGSQGGGGLGGGGGIGGGGTGSTSTFIKPDKENSDEADKEAYSAFSDVPSDAWYYDDISSLFMKGIIKGDADGSIRPEDNITREELVSIVVRTLGIEFDGEEYISDSTVSDWALNEMSAAVSNGIITGDENGVINGKNLCQRQDAAVIIGRAFKITASDKETFFADGGKISDYAAEYVDSLSGGGYINGYEDGTFRPENNITRAELFAVINRIIG